MTMASALYSSCPLYAVVPCWLSVDKKLKTNAIGELSWAFNRLHRLIGAHFPVSAIASANVLEISGIAEVSNKFAV